jgi:fibronectin-binding autotransporter adhesin
MTTISNHHNGSITISSAAYPSPVTVTSSGEVQGSAGTADSAGTTAVDMVTSGASLQNAGYILGGYGYGTGGSGVDMSAAGSITNHGTISGGAGTTISGDGVDLSAGSTLSNDQTLVSQVKNGTTYTRAQPGIIRGGYGTQFYGNPGGIGVSIAAGATLDNVANIYGGSGHRKYDISVGFFGGGYGAGGAGVYLAAGGTLTNNSVYATYVGRIFGGAGGTHGTAGAGGDGVVLAAGASFTNGG